MSSKAMFGISVFKRSITNDVITQIAQFMDANYTESMIILVDEPEIHNWLLRGRRSKDHAKEVVERTAENRINAIHRVLRRYSLDIPVRTWQFISANEQYQQNLAAVRQFYAANQLFKEGIQRQLKTYLQAYISQAEERLGRPLTSDELDGSAEFLLEELAGLAHLHYDLGYSIDIYPDEPGPTANDLLTGAKYWQLGKALRIRPEVYQYIVHPAPAPA